MRKLAIDLGSANIKIFGYDDIDETVFKIIKSRVSENGLDTNHIVELDGKALNFGVGTPLIKNDKTKREYIIETILLSSYYITDNDYIELSIGLGLPIDLYKSQMKTTYEAELNEQYCNHIISGVVNGREIQINIKQIQIFAEGYSAFVALYNFIPVASSKTIIDCGYRSTDVISIIDNKIDKYVTVNKGIYDINNDILSGAINDIGDKFELSVLESCIINNLPIKIGKQNYDVADYAHHGYNKIAEIFNEIELTIPNIKSSINFLVGGGCKQIYDIYENQDLDIQIADGDINIFANVIGYYMQL